MTQIQNVLDMIQTGENLVKAVEAARGKGRTVTDERAKVFSRVAKHAIKVSKSGNEVTVHDLYKTPFVNDKQVVREALYWMKRNGIVQETQKYAHHTGKQGRPASTYKVLA